MLHDEGDDEGPQRTGSDHENSPEGIKEEAQAMLREDGPDEAAATTDGPQATSISLTENVKAARDMPDEMEGPTRGVEGPTRGVEGDDKVM